MLTFNKVVALCFCVVSLLLSLHRSGLCGWSAFNTEQKIA